jgi:hypothetical protein
MVAKKVITFRHLHFIILRLVAELVAEVRVRPTYEDMTENFKF